MRPLDIYDHRRSAGRNRQTSEVEKRAAVNRLYYGLHHEACSRYFRKNPDAPPLMRNRRHAALSELFGSAVLSCEVHEDIADADWQTSF